MDAQTIIEHMKSLSDSSQVAGLRRFFKTEKGQYGEGDIFLGIKVPVTRKQIKLAKTASLEELEKLLHSCYHECRLLALLTLVHTFKSAKTMDEKRSKIIELYLKNTDYVNNWDLVDSSAHYILGPWLENKDRSILYTLAGSAKLWERRIAIMTCFHFIKNNDFSDALAISDILLSDSHDLIHKAVGWMLREIGNRNKAEEEVFLRDRYKNIPRTMLRYAIEKFSPAERANYLKGLI